MSAAGILGDIYFEGRAVGQCLLIGAKVPRIHHSDGVPVFQVAQHDDGTPIGLPGNRMVKLLAYPSAWPKHGTHAGRWVYAKHERLAWNAPVPLFDGGDT